MYHHMRKLTLSNLTQVAAPRSASKTLQIMFGRSKLGHAAK
jgi:hypothetical protein